ncbi:MAG: hypothetical protein ACO38K_08140 [Ilumatobacteraceae bacterium]
MAAMVVGEQGGLLCEGSIGGKEVDVGAGGPPVQQCEGGRRRRDVTGDTSLDGAEAPEVDLMQRW